MQRSSGSCHPRRAAKKRCEGGPLGRLRSKQLPARAGPHVAHLEEHWPLLQGNQQHSCVAAVSQGCSPAPPAPTLTTPCCLVCVCVSVCVCMRHSARSAVCWGCCCCVVTRSSPSPLRAPRLQRRHAQPNSKWHRYVAWQHRCTPRACFDSHARVTLHTRGRHP